MDYDKLEFWSTPTSQGNEVVKERTYLGFMIEADGEFCGTIDWKNTVVHNFILDSEFDYIEVAIESLAQFLGQEFPSGVARIPARANENLEDLYDELYAHSYPTRYEPLPTPEAIDLQARVGQVAIDAFLDEPLSN